MRGIVYEKDKPAGEAVLVESNLKPQDSTAPFHEAIFFESAEALENFKQGRFVLGTDIDRRCLAVAAAGQFEEGDFEDTPGDLRERYFAPAHPFTVAQSIREMVRFESRDLLRQPPPPGPHDLIVCRNVLIYFDRDTQERLFEMFHAALVPNGFLVLGKVETLLGKSRSQFAPVDARERIFRRL